jgi:pilus assembly protein Flp/PilA
MRVFLGRFLRDQSGATAIEYGLILSLMFLVIIGSLHAFGSAADGLFQRTMNALRGAMGG